MFDQATDRFMVDVGECQPAYSQHVARAKTAVWVDPVTQVQAYASVEMRPGKTEKDGCNVVYELKIAKLHVQFETMKLFEHQNETGEISGVTILGSSPDHSKIAVDFWWAEGDYDGIRPVIYDVQSGKAQFRDLEDTLYKKLPSCDYTQEYIGVTDRGYAVLHVPKSDYVDSEECKDRGFWLFDLKTGHLWQVEKNKIPNSIAERAIK